MTASLNQRNTVPYDYVTPGITGISADSESLASVGADAERLPFGYCTSNNQLATSYAGVTVGVAPMFQYFYDFATDGGAQGAIKLRGPKLPANFRVLNAVFEPTTAITSGGSAQISVGTSGSATTNLLAAAVLGTNGTAAPKLCVPDWATVADSVKVTDEVEPVINVTVADLTAGRATLTLFGYFSVPDSIA